MTVDIQSDRSNWYCLEVLLLSNQQRNDGLGETASKNKLKANKSTKIYSNHFAGGYRRNTCEKPIFYMKGYPDEGNDVQARENIDTKGKRKQHSTLDSEPSCREAMP